MFLEGKASLVTGAARGIGRATAVVLARHGARLAVVDIHPGVEETARVLREMGGESVCAVLDVADRDEVLEGVRDITSKLGQNIDILVNNAAIVDHISPVETMAPEGWDRELRVNLFGAFYMIQAVLPGMILRRWGRIINISSLGATGGLHRQAGYSASKAGLLGLTKTVAIEHAKDGITCNAVLPGLIGTEKVRAMPREILESSLALIPAGRLGLEEEVGHLVAFLASEHASYINGAEIPIDGGMRLNSGTLGSRKLLREKGRRFKE
jgi:NAD(P)-dependent dehydrogenase (short-subunit alcohol dehydrogenase family)